MVSKNFPKEEKETIYHRWRGVNVTIAVDLFNKVRELALEEDRSISNMICILVKRGINNTK